jgi:hypothetical protein
MLWKSLEELAALRWKALRQARRIEVIHAFGWRENSELVGVFTLLTTLLTDGNQRQI